MSFTFGMLPPDPIFCFRENMGHVHSICFPKRNPDYSDLLLAATEKGDVFFLDLECNRVQHKTNMGESIQTIHSIEYDIITQEKSGLVKLWSIENNSAYKTQRQFQCYGGYCKSVLFNNQLILPCDEGQVEVIDICNFESVKKFVPDTNSQLGMIMCLEPFEIRGTKYLLVGYESGNIMLFNYDYCMKPIVQEKVREFITSITFDPLTYRGVVSNSSHCLQVFLLDLETLQITVKADLNIPNAGCQIVKFRPDKKLFVSGGWDGKMRIYSSKTYRALAVLTEHKKQISDIQFSPNIVRYWESEIFAAGGEDGTVSLWNVYNNY